MTDRSRLEESAAAQFDTRRKTAATGGCPVSALAAQFTPFERSFLDDPYTFLT